MKCTAAAAAAAEAAAATKSFTAANMQYCWDCCGIPGHVAGDEPWPRVMQSGSSATVMPYVSVSEEDEPVE
jgi:hypothetical protein